MSLTPEQIQIVRSTAAILLQYGNRITTTFYETILKEHPELNNIFNQTNQINNHQAQALAGSLYAYATHIDDFGALSPAVEKICQKHASLYIRPEHYPIVGEGVLRAMKIVLGDACTPAILSAWEAAYNQLASIFISRENEVYSQSHGWTDWRDFTISAKIRESDEITSFYLKPVDGGGLPEYLPGQYISILTDVPQFGYQQSRQYSLSDAPRPDYYRISVKREAGLDPEDPDAIAHPGWISNVLHQEKDVGDVLQVSHPAGEFVYDQTKDGDGPLVLLSAGVGITPMMAILNTLIQRGTMQTISFIHGARNTSTVAFADRLREVSKANENVHAVTFIKNLVAGKDVEGRDFQFNGRLDLAKLDASNDLHLDDKWTKYFICGPESFMTSMSAGLKRLSVGEERIKMELFGTGSIPH